VSPRKTRFPFSYAWWGGFNWKRKAKDNLDVCESQHNWSQGEKYKLCGVKIKRDLLEGNAVVVFAYGLSGSGKTFTVFGFDDAKNPLSWFHAKDKHEEGAKMWGIFPNLGYEVLEEDRGDGWKISSKYFQNMVDMVRDLMDPAGKEQHYKQGFRKGEDGFMDIDWCKLIPITTWDHLRNTFRVANSRKGIAPTQFNPQSTRGHCVFTFEVSHPDLENEGMLKKGRLYLCDLAGTEPAGDVFYAIYKEIKYDDGTTEMQLVGPDSDASKTKELQSQGCKINQSLSEIKMFFEKLADGIKKKTLKPGGKIPGCNSFFLSKYLKDTLLSAKTYLFCACRPEAHYLKYTKATLDFAANASVVKLQPQKTGVKMSPQEKKLQEELDQMKALVEDLKKANALSQGGGSGDPEEDARQLDELKAQLKQKQVDLAAAMAAESSGGGPSVDESMETEKAEYGERGMFLSHFERESCSRPFFINIDEDAFRSERIMWIFEEGTAVVVGPGGDIQPSSISVTSEHCTIKCSDQGVSIIPQKGKIYVNGEKMEADAEKALTPYDRVVVGSLVYMFIWPGHNPPETEPMEAHNVMREFAAATMNDSDAGAAMFEEQKRAQDRQYKEQMAAKQAEFQAKLAAMAGGDAEAAEAEFATEQAAAAATHDDQMKASGVQIQVQELMRKIPELSNMCQMLDRPMLAFAVKLMPAETPGDAPKPKVVVRNGDQGEEVLLDCWEFEDRFKVVQDEMQKLQHAVAYGTEYSVPKVHDPLVLLFDNLFHLGSADYLLMEYEMMMETEDTIATIRNAVAPFDDVGKVEMRMTPVHSPEDPTPLTEDEMIEFEDPADLIGKPWTYQIEIPKVFDLKIKSDETFVQYMFDGELHCTEVIEIVGKEVHLQYKAIHHVDEVTQEFLDYLDEGRLHLDVFVNPTLTLPTGEHASVSTNNGNIRKFLAATAAVPKSVDQVVHQKARFLALENATKEEKVRRKKLEARVKELEAQCGITQREKELATLAELQSEMVAPIIVSSGKEIPQSELEIYANDFGKVDTDGSGYIESSELPALFKQQADREPTDQELLVLLQQFDTNHDGRVSLDEYMDVMLGAGWCVKGDVIWKDLDPTQLQKRMRTRVAWDIPTSPESLNPDFLTKALRKAGLIPSSTSVASISEPKLISRSGLNVKVVQFDVSYTGDKKFGPDQMVAKFPSHDLSKPGPLNPSRREWIAEMSGYRDIPARSLAMHRAQCYFAQGSCVLLQKIRDHTRDDTIGGGLSPAHAIVALRCLSQMHAMYWGYSPTSHPEFLHVDKERLVAFFRHIVAPGLQAAASIFPAHQPSLEGLAQMFERKMLAIAERCIFKEDAPITLGFFELESDDIWFLKKGDSIVDIEYTVDFQPMWAHPIHDISSFIVRSFAVAERKENEKNLLEAYHKALLERGIGEKQYPFTQCWEDYVDQITIQISSKVALLATMLAAQKAGGKLDTGTSAYEQCEEYSEKLAAAVNDLELILRFSALEDDA